MQFERTGMYQLESNEGYCVNVVKAAGVWVYHAQGPKRKQIRKGRVVLAVIDPLKGRIDSKVKYGAGDEMPFPREDLGTFRADQYAEATDARDAAIAACNKHRALVLQHQAEQEETNNIAGPSQRTPLRAQNTADFG